MRKPAYLAVSGISIVVAAVSLGVALTRYLGLRAYTPKAPPGSAAAPPGTPSRPHRRSSGTICSPRTGDEPAVPAPDGDRAVPLPGTPHGLRPRGDDRLLQPRFPPGDPVGGRDETAESVPGEGRGGARGVTFLHRAGQGVDRSREGAGKAGSSPRGSRVRPTTTAAPSVAPSVVPSVAAVPRRPPPTACPFTRNRARAAARRDAGGGLPAASSEDEEGLSRRERRRRSREGRR